MHARKLQVGDPAPPISAQPVFGHRIEVPAGLARGPMVLCFVRYLGCPFCRQALAELQAGFADFDRSGAQLVAVTQTALERAQDFVPRHHLLFPLIADPEGEIMAHYGVAKDRWLLSTAKGLLKVDPARALRAIRRGHGGYLGPEQQLPAEFVIDTQGTVAYARYGTAVTDGPDLECLRRCALSCS